MQAMLEVLQLYVVDILGCHLVATAVLPADGSFSPSVVPSALPDPLDGSASDLLLVEEFARRREIRLGKRLIDEVPDAVIDHGIFDNASDCAVGVGGQSSCCQSTGVALPPFFGASSSNQGSSSRAPLAPAHSRV